MYLFAWARLEKSEELFLHLSEPVSDEKGDIRLAGKTCRPPTRRNKDSS